MKTMKKIMALALVLTLMMALAVTANAGTITVQNPNDGETYKAYRVLDKVNVGDDEYYYKAAAGWEGFWYTEVDGVLSSKFPSAFTATKITVGGETVIALAPTESFKTNDNVRAAMAKEAKKYAEDNSLTATVEINGNDGSVTNGDITQGYYLLAGKGAIPAMSLLGSNDGTVTLREKNKLPQLEKTADKLSAVAGDIINYTVTITTDENIENKKGYILHDSMGAGLELLVDGTHPITVVHKSGATETTLVEGTDYTVKYNSCSKSDDVEGCTFEIVFGKVTTKAYDEFVVTYSAKVKDNANATNMTNNAKLTTEADYEDPEDDTEVYNYDFTVKKVDQNKASLNDAKFSLFSDATCQNAIELVAVDTNADGVIDYYRPATTTDTDTVTVFEVDGTITLKGFAAGTYYLKETEAPNGYVKTEEVFTIKLKDEDGPEAKPADGVLDADSTSEITIINVKAEELPETGGIGTTIFYLAGGIMATGALTLLVTKKRVGEKD